MMPPSENSGKFLEGNTENFHGTPRLSSTRTAANFAKLPCILLECALHLLIFFQKYKGQNLL